MQLGTHSSKLTSFFSFASLCTSVSMLSIIIKSARITNLFFFFLQFGPGFTFLKNPLMNFADALAWAGLVLE